jgi:hypothetical protein
LRASYKIKGRLLAVQFYFIVILVFLVIRCIYIAVRMTGRGNALEKPAPFRDMGFDMALDLREMSPANRDNVLISISLPSGYPAGGIIADGAPPFFLLE